MTQENKELLLKDLCGRLPYGVKISIPDLWINKRDIEILEEIFKGDDGLYRVNSKGQLIEYIKPYLFPISSMTEELKEEHKDLLENQYHFDANGNVFTLQDFYCKYHIDYRGLIPMGLVNDATGLNIY